MVLAVVNVDYRLQGLRSRCNRYRWIGRTCRKAEGLMRVVIADDHPVVLAGVRMLLETQCTDCQLVGEVHGGASLLALLANQSCDLVITDFSMPVEGESVDGLGMIGQLRERYPRLAILVLTMSHNPALIKGMLKTGANAVIEKKSMIKELILAIQMVRTGRSYVSEHLRHRLAEDHAKPGTQSVHGDSNNSSLSMREVEIMRMLTRGMTVTDIAKATSRSIKTISQQKRDAMRKLSIDSDSQLFEYMRTRGL